MFVVAKSCYWKNVRKGLLLPVLLAAPCWAWAQTKSAHTQDLLQRANAGDMVAQRQLAVAYRSGKLGDPDLDQSMYWYHQAADQGDTLAKYMLGFFYSIGGGATDIDYQQSFDWYQQAADDGMLQAQLRVAQALALGKGVPRDLAGAFYYYRLAASQGNHEAQHQVGLLYIRGEGTSKNPDLARAWLMTSAWHGNRAAQTALQSLD